MGISLNVPGTEELSRALADAFSPISETLGAIGDRIRVYRHVSLIRCLEKAEQIAKAEGISLNEPPLKFLVPYLEDCSLEDPNDEDLIEMWAKLLTSACSDPKARHAFFVRVLREISSAEASLLKRVVSISSHAEYSNPWHLEDVDGSWNESSIKNHLADLIEKTGKPLDHAFPFHELEDDFRRTCEGPGSIIHHFDVACGEPGKYPLTHVHIPERHDIHDKFSPLSFALLRNLGLMQNYSSPEIWIGTYAFQIDVYYITRLGVYFIDACTQEKISSRCITPEK